MRIDAHTHVWPESIASRALSRADVDVPAVGDGTVSGLDRALEEAGIDRGVCLAVANTPDRVEAANRFAASLDSRTTTIGFGTIHAALSPEKSLDSLRRHGLRGVKVHPLFQNYRLDDPQLIETLDALRDDYIVVAHVGAGRDAEANERCTPPMLLNLIQQLPGLRLVACHFGGFRQLEQAAELIIGESIYLDTSWPPSLSTLDPNAVRRLIERHGADRIVFASDWPMADPSREVEAIERLRLGEAATTAILGDNFQALLDGLPRASTT